MSSYASVEDVQKGFRALDSDEKAKCESLLDEAAIIIDSYKQSEKAKDEAKKVVCCKMVRRVLGDGSQGYMMPPIGASQNSVSGFGYAQSWQFSGGTSGELYLSKLEKKMLGIGERIGSHSPLEDL